MIVIEGPDGTGKTTLARDLSRKFGLEYSRPPAHALSSEGGALSSALADWWVEQVAAVPSMRIYDRTYYISDPIYRPHSGRTPLEDGPSFCRNLAAFIQSAPAIVFCLPPLEIAMANTFDQEEGRPQLSYLDREKAEIVYWQYWAAYELWFEACPEWVKIYNWENREQVIDFVADSMRGAF